MKDLKTKFALLIMETGQDKSSSVSVHSKSKVAPEKNNLERNGTTT